MERYVDSDNVVIKLPNDPVALEIDRPAEVTSRCSPDGLRELEHVNLLVRRCTHSRGIVANSKAVRIVAKFHKRFHVHLQKENNLRVIIAQLILLEASHCTGLG